MIGIEAIADAIELPEMSDGWFDYSYTALADGRLAIIRTRKDIRAEQLQWMTANAEKPWLPRAHNLWDGDVRLSIFDGSRESDAVTIPPVCHPTADRMCDGRWLVAGSRSQPGEKNGTIYSADGCKEHAMVLGDGIEHLLCAPDGTIWVGYFDEGVFGGPNKDGSWPVSCGGVVQFDTAGNVLWSFNEQAGGDLPVDDAYAMTLSGSELWACYYSGFPIVRIGGGKSIFWLNSIDGAKAIAVEGNLAILAGGYGKQAGRIALVKLERGTSRQIGKLQYAQREGTAASLLQGRGNTLHIVRDGIWYKLPVREAADAIGRGAFGAYDGSGGGT